MSCERVFPDFHVREEQTLSSAAALSCYNQTTKLISCLLEGALCLNKDLMRIVVVYTCAIFLHDPSAVPIARWECFYKIASGGTSKLCSLLFT